MNEDRELQDDLRAARLLGALPEPTPAALHRVRGRLVKGPSRAEVPMVRGLWLLGVGAFAGALTAAALFAARADLERSMIRPSVPVARTLEAGQGFENDATIRDVALSYSGTGTVGGTSDAPQIAWDNGLLNVEVTADKGIRLAVTTKEAVVRVIGTGFTVTRDTLGTRVDVRHGRVEVDCGDEATRALNAGDGVTCLPRSAAGLLGRARALQAANAPAADALEALDRGLAIVGPQPAVRDELNARRVSALYGLGRHGEVIDAARAYVSAGGGTRQAEMVQIAAASADVLGGCATAAPWLLEAGPVAVEACR